MRNRNLKVSVRKQPWRWRNLAALILLLQTSAPTGNASGIVLARNRIGPVLVTSQGDPAVDSLVRVGTFIGAPASNSFEDISFVFREFDTLTTDPRGALGGTVTNADGNPFNQQQVYVWAFDSPEIATATEHAIFTVFDTPANGDEWLFPIHTGAGTDFATLDLMELYTIGDASFTPGVLFQSSDQQIILTPIPEPTASLLVAGVAFLLVRRRR